MTSHSEETAVHRCNEDAVGYRKRVSRRLSSPQIVFGRHQCARQALRCAVSSNNNATTLTDSHQEFGDVKDKLMDLVPWLTTLRESLTEASNDPREAERREQLKRSVTLFQLPSLPKSTVYRSLETIAKMSQALLDKRKMSRILDKTMDSQTVAKLVEQLRQAILIYQVGPMCCRDQPWLPCFESGIAATVNTRSDQSAGRRVSPLCPSRCD